MRNRVFKAFGIIVLGVAGLLGVVITGLVLAGFKPAIVIQSTPHTFTYAFQRFWDGYYTYHAIGAFGVEWAHHNGVTLLDGLGNNQHTIKIIGYLSAVVSCVV